MWVRRPLLGGGCILFASSEVKVVNKKIFAGFVSLILVSKISCASAQQFGTAEEARAMLDHAIAALKSNEDKALAEFNDPDNNQSHDHDLYVVCFNIRRQNHGLFRPVSARC
jgi:hypothetical protein